MTRRLPAFLAALAVALLAAWAHAQEAEPADSAKLNAIDASAMIEAWDGKSARPAPVPLGGRALRVFGAGDGAKPLELTTDAEGHFTLPLAGIAPGKAIRLLALGADRKPTHAASWFDPRNPGFEMGVPFYRMATESPLLAAALIQNVVVARESEGAKPHVRTNLIAQILNQSYELWLGDARAGMEALRLPVMRGFQVVAVKRGDEDLPYDLDTAGSGAAAVVVRGVDFEPSSQPQVIRVVATGPYEDGAVYDFSFTAALPIEEFRLNLAETEFEFTPGAAGGLRDAGANPGVNGIMTRGWMATEVHAGTRVEAQFTQGLSVHPRTWWTIAVLALTVLGAVLLGKALASGAAARPSAAAAPVDDAAERFRELERRHARGEITEFELRARKAALASQPAPDTGDPLRAAAEIEARAANAPPEQLRKDVRTLAQLLREALRR